MIRRTISWPVLVTTIAAIAAATVSFRALHQWQLSRVSEALLTRAQGQEREQAWLEAADYLDRYLRLQPDNLSARTQLALVYAKGANTLEENKTTSAALKTPIANALRPQCEVGSNARGIWSFAIAASFNEKNSVPFC